MQVTLAAFRYSSGTYISIPMTALLAMCMLGVDEVAR